MGFFIFIMWLTVAGFTAAVASSKGRWGFGWFCLGALFGVFALVAVGFMPVVAKKD